MPHFISLFMNTFKNLFMIDELSSRYVNPSEVILENCVHYTFILKSIKSFRI